MRTDPNKFISVTLAGAISLAPIMIHSKQDIQNKEGTKTTIVLIGPEPYAVGKEIELHHEEFTYQDNFNFSGTSYAASGIGESFIFGGEVMEPKDATPLF